MAAQHIDSVLLAAAAAGVVDSTRASALRAGVSARSVGVQQSGRIPEAALLWLWGALADHAGSHRVGAEVARFANSSTFGLLGATATRTVSLVDAFEHVARYARLVHQGVTVEIGGANLFFTVTYRRAGSSVQPASGGVAASILWATANLALVPERAFGVHLRPMSAELACVAVGDLGGVIADIFGTDVKFEAAECRLVFDRQAILAVSRPIASSALAYLDASAERALGDIPPLDDIIGTVAAEIRGCLAGRPPTVAEIAHALGLSTRTLQRRLTDAGKDFGAILDDVRRAGATVLMADDSLNLAEIAYKLGYSEHSAFTRAAIRWFGVPPSSTR